MPSIEEVCLKHGLTPPDSHYPGLEARLDDVAKAGGADGYIYLFADGRGGFIQNHRNEDEGEVFFTDATIARMSVEQIVELRAAKERRDIKKQLERDRAQSEVWQIWRTCVPASPDHPYIARKGVPNLAGAVRLIGQGSIGPWLLKNLQAPIAVAPIVDWDNALKSVEYIGADGERRFHPGGEKEGNFCVIGAEFWSPGAFYLAEGLSTAASISAATSRPCLVAFDAGNLPKVAQEAGRRIPQGSVLVVCGDDDVALERIGKKNKGRMKAEEATRLGNAVLALPDFTGLADRGDWSDFNDLAALRGIEEVGRQLHKATSPRSATPDWLQDPMHDLPVEFGEAEIGRMFARMRSHDMKYVKKWGRWLRYEGGRWADEDTGLAFDLIGSLLGEIVATRPNARNVSSLRKAATIGGVEKIASADRRVAAYADQWDRDDWLLNTPGGVLDLRTGALDEHRPEYYMKHQTAAPPGGDAPRWRRFIDEVTRGDRDLAEYLKRLAGYCLTGATHEQVLIFFWGSGANGKGTFINTMKHVMGSYYKAAASETFTESRNDRHKSELAVLQGARLVTSSEIDQGKSWAEKRIKELTGQDTITANYMRQDPFDFVPKFKLIIASNNKPRFSVVDPAIRRRLQLVPFLQDFDASGTKDPHLGENLKSESAGIMGWAVEGCLEWQRIGLQPPEVVRSATTDYLDSEDLEGQWIAERLVADPLHDELLATLFVDWCEYASKRHGRQKRDRDLSDRLVRQGCVKTKTRDGAAFRNIRLARRGEQNSVFPSSNVVRFPSS